MTHQEKRAKANRKSKQRKQRARALAFTRWVNCCMTNLAPWDCFCTYGCDCCNIHQRCAKCGTGYRDHEITQLNLQYHVSHQPDKHREEAGD